MNLSDKVTHATLKEYYKDKLSDILVEAGTSTLFFTIYKAFDPKSKTFSLIDVSNIPLKEAIFEWKHYRVMAKYNKKIFHKDLLAMIDAKLKLMAIEYNVSLTVSHTSSSP